MVWVIASFDPRTNTYECHTTDSIYDLFTDPGVVQYRGTKFYIARCGETFKEAENRALDGLLRYFADRSMFHADKGTRFADYCNFICDVQRKKVPAE